MLLRLTVAAIFAVTAVFAAGTGGGWSIALAVVLAALALLSFALSGFLFVGSPEVRNPS